MKEHQDLSAVTDAWLAIDCDGDTVSNATEIFTDNTDEHDWCSFLIPSLIPANLGSGWRANDCDDDGRDNGEEIDAGTDPLDPNNFPGSGTKIVTAIMGNMTHYFSNGGTQYDRIVNEDNTIATEFTYDGQGKLITVFVEDKSSDNDHITINYTYTNDLISRVDIDEGGELTAFNVVHEGNTISTFEINGDLPDGIFKRKFTFDPVTDKVILRETFYADPPNIRLIHKGENFFYDNTNGDISRTSAVFQGYLVASQTFTSQGIDPLPTTETFTYVEEAKNPIYEVAQRIYIHHLLTPEIFRHCWVETYGAFSQNYRRNYSYSRPGLFYSRVNTTDAVQTNGYPLSGEVRANFYSGMDTEFYYQE